MEKAVQTPTIPPNQSPLLKLPAELRNKIYGYVLCDQAWHIKDSRYHPTEFFYLLRNPKHETTSFKQRSPPSRNPLGLLATCRQIYVETRILPYTRSEFYLHNKPTFDTWTFSRRLFQSRVLHSIQLRCTILITIGRMGSEITGATWPLDNHKHDQRLLNIVLPERLRVHLHVRVFYANDRSKTFLTNSQDYPEMLKFVRKRMTPTDVALCTEDVNGYVQFTYHRIPEVL